MNVWKKCTVALCAMALAGCGTISEQWSVFERGLALADAEKRTNESVQSYVPQAPAQVADKTVEKAAELVRFCCEKAGGTWSDDSSCGFAEEGVNQEEALATCLDESKNTAPKAG